MIDWRAEQSDCFVGTAIAIASAIAAAASSGAAIYSAHKQSDTAETAAKLATDATTHGADLQKQSNDEALAFTKSQAEADYQNQEIARRANYDQTAAKQARLGTLGNMLGLPPPTMPDYVPSVDPRYTTAGSAPAPGSGAAPAGGTPAPGTTTPGSQTPAGAPGSSAAALADFYKSIGVTPGARGSGGTDLAYYADQMDAHGGPTAANVGYFTGRIKQDLAGTTGSAAPPGATPPTGTLGAMLQPYRVANPTAALTPGGY